MNDDIQFERLTPLDVESFLSKRTVVRLFIGGNWYAGILLSFLTKNEPWHALMNPYGQFSHNLPMDPYVIKDALVNDNCLPIAGSLVKDGQFFRITNPQKVIFPESPNGILAIKLDDGVMIMSHRKPDWVAVKKILQSITVVQSA